MKKTLFSTALPPFELLACENLEIVNPLGAFPLEEEKLFIDKVNKYFSLPSNTPPEYLLIAAKLEEKDPDYALWANPIDAREVLALYEVWQGVKGNDFKVLTCSMREEISQKRKQENLEQILKTLDAHWNKSRSQELEEAILKDKVIEEKISDASFTVLSSFYEKIISYDFESAPSVIKCEEGDKANGNVNIALFGDIFYSRELFDYFEEVSANIVFIQKLFDLLQWDLGTGRLNSWINHFVFAPFEKKLKRYRKELIKRNTDAVIAIFSSFSHLATAQEIYLKKLPFKVLMLECEVSGRLTQRELNRVENFMAAL